ncbi:MAG: hypothetical protein DRJ42_27175 [Deltaproteobacteria bacterium]|nr:MAG: hypothetical protein DRJ42_27175 [Deltaproteobacteria bacterium]
MRAALILVTLPLFGCALFHTAPGDAAADSGTGMDAGDTGASPVDCGHIGPYLQCDETCDPCGEDGSYCGPAYEICRPYPVDNPSDGCHLVRDPDPELRGSALTYCENELICALHPTLSQDSQFTGLCVDPDYCREARDRGVDTGCVYSDFSEFVEGPPTGDPCPADEASPMAPLCGEGCGTDVCSWPIEPGSSWAATSCIGLSEERGVGVCVFYADQPCERAWPSVIEEFIDGCNRDLGTPCACLAKRNEDGTLWDRAWPIVEQSCRLYASLYPDDFACVGADWVPLE